ncbi:hypothetical protein VLK31_34715 [Variovorax sp. H27-G14]|uniref:hypothetical protein n=1 Tax=Variovorax sp. H27-G14 TaxID=3111914 RepID=UPI0038FD25AF
MTQTTPTPGAGERVSVNADALRQVLQALVGPGHYIRELQFTRSLHKLGHPNAINTLLEDYEAAALRAQAVEGEQSAPAVAVVDLPAGQKLYKAFINNHPTMHSNRFPSWAQLTETERKTWRRKARAALTQGVKQEGDSA